jgi:hypothetical protein
MDTAMGILSHRSLHGDWIGCHLSRTRLQRCEGLDWLPYCNDWVRKLLYLLNQKEEITARLRLRQRRNERHRSRQRSCHDLCCPPPRWAVAALSPPSAGSGLNVAACGKSPAPPRPAGCRPRLNLAQPAALTLAARREGRRVRSLRSACGSGRFAPCGRVRKARRSRCPRARPGLARACAARGHQNPGSTAVRSGEIGDT